MNNQNASPTGCIRTQALVESLDTFKALADPGRLRIFWLLAQIDARICVSEAMDVLGVSHYNASRHLATLKQAELVCSTREGRRVFYALNTQGSPFLASILKAVRSIPAQAFQSDIQRCQLLLALRTGSGSTHSPSNSQTA